MCGTPPVHIPGSCPADTAREFVRMQWDVARAEGKLVGVSTLKPGQRFITGQGLVLRYERTEHLGVHHCVDDAGTALVYGSSAKVLPLASD